MALARLGKHPIGKQFLVCVLAGLLCFRGLLIAADPPALANTAIATERGQILDDRQLAAAIDAYFEQYWAAQSIEPAAEADDAEFVRRVYLDFAGKIPPVSEVRTYLESVNSTKRAELIDSLLQQGAYARHFANRWSEVLLAGANDNAETRALAPRLETWLRLRLAANVGLDQIAAELLTPRAEDTAARRVQAADAVPDPSAFFQAADRKPEQLAANTSRVFLGLQVQCAQCHDHPQSHWTRREFWSFAALFTDYGDGPPGGGLSATNPAEFAGLKIPETETYAPTVFLDGSVPDATAARSRRVALVRWLTGPDNRWFSLALANRIWEHLLGRGLIDPTDDLEAAGPNDHPELLARVAEQFRAHDYDLQYLLRAISATRLYGFSSRRDPERPTARHQFARMPLRKMTAEQLFDSLVQATGLREAAASRAAVSDIDSIRGGFREKFSDPSIARTEAETSILQALSLMNGKLVMDGTALAQGETLAAVVDAPFLDTGGKIDTLFLATLSRRPAEAESRQFREYVERSAAQKVPNAALADVFWALLNSAEFMLVH